MYSSVKDSKAETFQKACSESLSVVIDKIKIYTSYSYTKQ